MNGHTAGSNARSRAEWQESDVALRPQGIRRILGIDFFQGSARDAVDAMRGGGLLVIPAAPALKDLPNNHGYREALLRADVVLTDSAFMVMVWNLLCHDQVKRLSGLAYLRELLQDKAFCESGRTLWVMPNEGESSRNVCWLRANGVSVPDRFVYTAPVYQEAVVDAELLELIEATRPDHVVLTLGGGTQELLGLYLKEHLDYRPAIHCVGAAIAFLSGVQVRIPVWADRLYLGWLFRSLSEPLRFAPRYWNARKLYTLLRQYKDRLPA